MPFLFEYFSLPTAFPSANMLGLFDKGLASHYVTLVKKRHTCHVSGAVAKTDCVKLMETIMKNYQDFCHNIANTIFDIINRNGSMLKWKKSWQMDGSLALPIGTSGVYRGGNLFNLLKAQVDKGSKPIWVTFNQVNNMDGKILKGAKSHVVYFWKILNKTEIVGGESVDKTIPLFKTYRVFNIEQTSLNEESIIINDNVTLSEILANHNVEISTFGNQPRFIPSDDVIVMPKREYFNSEEDFTTTLLH